jgi:hypothetical protein
MDIHTWNSRHKLHAQTSIVRIPSINTSKALECPIRFGRMADPRVGIDVRKAAAYGPTRCIDLNRVFFLLPLLLLSIYRLLLFLLFLLLA